MLAKYIREIRCRHAYSIEYLASLCNMSPEKIRLVECGTILPSVYFILQIARIFSLDENELLSKFHHQLTLGRKNRLPDWEADVSSRTAWHKQEKGTIIKLLQVYEGLTNYVESIAYFEQPEQPYTYERILPDGMSQLVICLGTTPSALFIGQRDKPIILSLEKDIRKVIIRFHSYGAYLLTGLPQNRLTNLAVDASCVFGPSINALCDLLSGCHELNRLTEIVNCFFMKHIDIPKQQSQSVHASVVQFLSSHIDKPISELVRRTGYSQKHLIHLFRLHTGLTPKLFQQVRQFSEHINEYSLASGHGNSIHTPGQSYFDQSHFIRQFIRFSGFTPSAYIKTGNVCPRMIMTA